MPTGLRQHLRPEVSRQQGDVFGTLSQWRNQDANDIEPIPKVLPEASSSHFSLQWAIGRRNDPDVDSARKRFSDATDLSFLEYP